jgi:hypothetical protein
MAPTVYRSMQVTSGGASWISKGASKSFVLGTSCMYIDSRFQTTVCRSRTSPSNQTLGFTNKGFRIGGKG